MGTTLQSTSTGTSEQVSHLWAGGAFRARSRDGSSCSSFCRRRRLGCGRSRALRARGGGRRGLCGSFRLGQRRRGRASGPTGGGGLRRCAFRPSGARRRFCADAACSGCLRGTFCSGGRRSGCGGFRLRQGPGGREPLWLRGRWALGTCTMLNLDRVRSLNVFLCAFFIQSSLTVWTSSYIFVQSITCQVH